MNCPVCTTVNLVMSERQGIEIDYCPQCRGVWLDRGELDKIIEKSILATPSLKSEAPAYQTAPAQRPPQPGYQPQPSYQPHHPDYSQRHPQDGYYKRKKREGFLSDLFDF
jgi:uncharacterized protein